MPLQINKLNTSWEQIEMLKQSLAYLTPAGWVFPKGLQLMIDVKAEQDRNVDPNK